MEKQKAITDRIAAAIFYGKTEPVEIPGKGKIRIHAEYTKNGYSSIVNFSFTDELVQKEYLDFYKRAVGTRDSIDWKDGKVARVKLSQIDLFLHKLLNDTLHKRHQPFLTDEVKKALAKYPYRSQDGKGMKAKVIMRFFNPVGTGTWYVTEMADVLYQKNAKKGTDYVTYEKRDPDFSFDKVKDVVFFGLAELGYEFEWGSFSMSELSGLILPHDMEIERDEHIPPLKYTLEECFKMYNEQTP
jgi:hypothetical protein